MSRQALEGLKVVEVGNIIAGPWCGTMMADFGARVIKVEQPGTGDLIRGMGRIKDLWYAVEARNKMSVSLNLKDPKGKEILWKLIEDADVLIQNFRPGVFDKLGFTWEEIHKRNPRLIYTVASGYGTTGDALPHNTIVRRYIDLGGEIFTFGSDSHATDRDYDNIERAKDAVRAMGGKYQASFCQRKMTLYRI